MVNKINLLIVFGANSPEHEISQQSAQSIINNLDLDKYNLVITKLDLNNNWLLKTSNNNFTHINIIELITKQNIQAILPVVHGAYGEDGKIQGFFNLLNLPIVGPSLINAAMTMDKDITKRLLQHANIKTANYINITGKLTAQQLTTIKNDLKYPCFIKPVNSGSSLGINKAYNETELIKYINIAKDFDPRVIVEEFIDGKELECAILTINNQPQASLVGEIKTNHDFYTYEAKYIDPNYQIDIPAAISTQQADTIRKIAIDAFTALLGKGMARVDFFLTKHNEIYLNEINTIPGFTKISMFPKLWAASGINYSDLLDTLIQNALNNKLS